MPDSTEPEQNNNHNQTTSDDMLPCCRGLSVVGRWLDVLFMSVVALAITMVMLLVLSPIVQYLEKQWLQLSPALLIVVGGVFLGGIITRISSAGGIRLTHLKHLSRSFRYPPFWLAILLPVGLDIWLPLEKLGWPRIEWVTIDTLWLILATLLSGLLFTMPKWIIERYNSRNHKKGDRNQAELDFSGTPDQLLETLTDNPEQLILWLKHERPVRKPEDDQFGVAYRAEQIAEALLNHPSNAVGLIGGFGSGKSSLMNLVWYYLNNKQWCEKNRKGKKYKSKLIHVTVKEWGRTDDASTVSFLLKEAVAEVSKYVDCLSLVNLPSKYVQAMKSAAGKWWGLSLLLFEKEQTSEEQLRRLNHILATIDAHLIICIEDIDRNTADTAELKKKYVQFQALLDQLKKDGCDRITFVLTAKSTAFDFSRLCEHRFNMPEIDLGLTGVTIQALRWYALREAGDKESEVLLPFKDSRLKDITYDIDPRLSEEEIKDIKANIPKIKWAIAYHIEDENIKLDDASFWKSLCPLVNNPRRLKETLRHTWRIWQKLHGEIAFDDLLIYQALRAASPNIFDVIKDWKSASKLSPILENEKQEYNEKFTETWDRILAECDKRDWPYIEKIFGELLGVTAPSVSTKKAVEDVAEKFLSGSSADKGFQVVAADGPYWQRVWQERLDPRDKVRDQEVLHAIWKWKKDPNQTELPERLYDGDAFVVVFERFESSAKHLQEGLQLMSEELMTLAAYCYDRLLTEFGTDATIRESSGAMACRQLIIKHRLVKSAKLVEWVKEQIGKALPISLRLALDIALDFTRDVSTLNESEKNVVWQYFYESARKQWGNPEKLIKTLSINSQWTAFSLSSFLYPRIGFHVTKNDQRRRLINIIRAMKIKPEVVIPSSLIIFTDSDIDPSVEYNEWGDKPDMSYHLFMHKRTCELLPDLDKRKSCLQNLVDVAEKVEPDKWSTEIQGNVAAYVKVIKQYLAEGAPCAKAVDAKRVKAVKPQPKENP